MKENKFFTKLYGNVTKGWIINRVICSIVMIALIVAVNIGNTVADTFALQLTAYLCPPIVDNSAVDKAQAAASELAKEVELEGATLLKNDNVLPLSKTDDKKVNVFGYGSVDWVYGGIGNGCSGQVRPENDDINSAVDLIKSLKRYGISTNTEIQDFYKSWCEPVNLIKNPNEIDRTTARLLREPSMDKYSSDLLSRAKEYSSTAIAVISRICHENIDLPNYQEKGGPGQVTDYSRHYLEISTEEEEMLKYLGDNYEKVIVVINTGNMMELSFMDTIKGLDACVYVGTTGTQAAISIPSLLYGDTPFSGKLADTIPYSFDYSPASYSTWYIKNGYTNSPNENGWGVDYVEGIYVGYKWFETADHEGIWNNSKYSRTILDNEGNNKTLKGYDSVVQYPFGYGLSYTTFEWSNASIEIKDKDNKVVSDGYITDESKITINVTVKNTGAVAGKDVVQVYLTAPFTKGGIEKSYVNLVGYEKTIVLEPQSEQKLSIEIDANDFTSYDCYDMNKNNHTGYELESGDYELKLMTDSHNMKKLDKNTFVVKVKDTINLTKDKYTGQEVNNKFTYPNAYDGYALDGNNGEENANIPYIKRGEFPDPYEFKKGENRKVTSEIAKKVRINQTLGNEWDNATKDVFGRDVDTSKVL